MLSLGGVSLLTLTPWVAAVVVLLLVVVVLSYRQTSPTPHRDRRPPARGPSS